MNIIIHNLTQDSSWKMLQIQKVSYCESLQKFVLTDAFLDSTEIKVKKKKSNKLNKNTFNTHFVSLSSIEIERTSQMVHLQELMSVLILAGAEA